MKIYYHANVLGDTHAERIFIDYIRKKGDADLVIIGGNFIQQPFTSLDQLSSYERSFNILEDLQDNRSGLLYHFAQEIIAKNNGRLETEAARSYIEIIGIAEANMKITYEKLRRIWQKIDIPILIVPGNNDGKCLRNKLNRTYIHLRKATVDDLIVAGYGSGFESDNTIPDLTVPFNEFDEFGITHSEPYEWLSTVDPDIAVVHAAPDPMDDKGSEDIADFIEECSPSIVLTSGYPSRADIAVMKTTYVVSPGSLGRSNGLSGTFFELMIDERKALKWAKLHQIVDFRFSKELKNVKEKVRYLAGDNSLVSKIFD